MEVDTVAGVPRVTIAGEGERWTLVDEITIGAGVDAPASDPSAFAWVSSVSVGPDGDLYVADMGRDHIAVFGQSGAFVRSLGREGRGPGEFDELFSIDWLGNTLLAMDLGNGRTTAFDREGEWIGRWSSAGRLVASPVHFRIYGVGDGEAYRWGYSLEDGLETPVWVVHRVDGDTTRVRRYTPPPLETGIPDRVVCQMGRGFSWFIHPWAPRAVSHPMSKGRTVVARTDRYRLTILSRTLDTLVQIDRVASPLKVDDEAWTDLNREFDEWLEDKDPGACEPRRPFRPDIRPILESLLVDHAGRIWVERNLPDGTRWEVFSESGRLLGQVPGFDHDRVRTVPWLGDDRVAWVSRGELDIPSVHVARIRTGEGASLRSR